MPRKNIFHHYMPTTGVRDDFLVLMNKFIELKTVRFSEFSEIWRSKKMSFLCAGRYSDRESREFVDRAFMIALDFFLPPYQFQVRVGGLYLLYSLFETQPIVPKTKVRLTQTQWEETLKFQQEACQQNHIDVVYVFNKMLQDHAFHFCFTPAEMCSRTYLHESRTTELNLADGMKDDRREIDTLFNYESMEKLSYLLDHYQQMKVNLAGPEANKPDKSLDVVQGTMVEDLVTMLQSFKTSVSNINKHGKPDEMRNDEQAVENATESILTRRQTLKAKAFSEIRKQGPRSNFIMQVEGTSSSEQNSQLDIDDRQAAGNCLDENISGDKDGHSINNPMISNVKDSVYSKEIPKIHQALKSVKFVGDTDTHKLHYKQTDKSNVIRVEVYSKSTVHEHDVKAEESHNNTDSVLPTGRESLILSEGNISNQDEKGCSSNEMSLSSRSIIAGIKDHDSQSGSTNIQNDIENVTLDMQCYMENYSPIKSPRKGKGKKSKTSYCQQNESETADIEDSLSEKSVVKVKISQNFNTTSKTKVNSTHKSNTISNTKEDSGSEIKIRKNRKNIGESGGFMEEKLVKENSIKNENSKTERQSIDLTLKDSSDMEEEVHVTSHFGIKRSQAVEQVIDKSKTHSSVMEPPQKRRRIFQEEIEEFTTSSESENEEEESRENETQRHTGKIVVKVKCPFAAKRKKTPPKSHIEEKDCSDSSPNLRERKINSSTYKEISPKSKKPAFRVALSGEDLSQSGKKSKKFASASSKSAEISKSPTQSSPTKSEQSRKASSQQNKHSLVKVSKTEVEKTPGTKSKQNNYPKGAVTEIVAYKEANKPTVFKEEMTYGTKNITQVPSSEPKKPVKIIYIIQGNSADGQKLLKSMTNPDAKNAPLKVLHGVDKNIVNLLKKGQKTQESVRNVSLSTDLQAGTSKDTTPGKVIKTEPVTEVSSQVKKQKKKSQSFPCSNVKYL